MEANKKKNEMEEETVNEKTAKEETTENQGTTDDMAEKEKKMSDKITEAKETAENMTEEATEKEEGRYKILAELEENLWTYGSPIILEQGILERDQISKKNRLTLKFTNIYQEVIRDVYLTVFAGEGENVETIEHSYVALGQQYLKSKGTAAKIHVKNEEARTFKIRIDSIVFEDGSVWEKEDAFLESAGSMEDLETFAEAKTKDYEDNYISGKEAVAKDDSVSINDGIEILKRIIWYKDTKEILKDAKRKYTIVKQNEERKQASEDKRANRQKAVKKRYITAGIVVLVIAAAVVIFIFAFFIPNGKYQEAKKLLGSENYEQAASAFQKLNGFLSSEGYLAQAYYNLGLNELSNGDEEKASDYFSKSNEADEDSDYGIMAGAFLDYYEGVKALNDEDYDKALELFQSSANAASDFNLINKASAGTAQISYMQGQYETAWNTIKNVYAKDASYEAQYGEYGYGYAKYLVDNGKISEGMEIYNSIAGFTKSANLNESVYNQAVKLGESGKIAEAMELLNQIKSGYKKANRLYEKMYKFDRKVKLWLGTWRHKGTVNGEKKVYKIKISEVLYNGKMCLRIVDQNNDYLGFDTVISDQNRVTQIQIGMYMLHFKLKKFHNQKFTYTLLEGNKMRRELKYNGETYTMRYKKKVK